mgnify:CR=1 FL=1
MLPESKLCFVPFCTEGAVELGSDGEKVFAYCGNYSRHLCIVECISKVFSGIGYNVANVDIA